MSNRKAADRCRTLLVPLLMLMLACGVLGDTPPTQVAVHGLPGPKDNREGPLLFPTVTYQGPTATPTPRSSSLEPKSPLPTAKPHPYPVSTTVFLSPLAGLGLEEIWFSSQGALYRLPMANDGIAAGPASHVPLDLPPNGSVGRALWLAPNGNRLVYTVVIVPQTCGDGCSPHLTMHALDLSTGESRQFAIVGLSGPLMVGWHQDSRYFRFANDVGEIGLINVDTGERIVVGEVCQWTECSGLPLRVYGMALSPDGQWVAVGFAFERLEGEVWMARTDGSEARKLFGESSGSGMSWSPDGHHIAFAGLGVEVMDADGQNRRTVGDGYVGTFVSAWSPDGRYLAFTTREESKYLVHVVDVVEGTSAVLGRDIPGGTLGPAWSPDGERIVFGANWSDEQGTSEIWVANCDGTGLHQLISGGIELSNPVWVLTP